MKNVLIAVAILVFMISVAPFAMADVVTVIVEMPAVGQ